MSNPEDIHQEATSDEAVKRRAVIGKVSNENTVEIAFFEELADQQSEEQPETKSIDEQSQEGADF
jgi:hypothetical protein